MAIYPLGGGGGGIGFKTISVSGQPAIVADIIDDTLTVVAGTNVTVLTDDTTDTITFSATGTGGGGGDVSSNTSTSVDAEIPLFSGTGGKTIKRATGTGIVKVTSGVFGTASAGDFPTLNQNTTGTASNVSGTPALPNGTTATTQTQADASTKLATTAYVDTGLGTKQASLGFTAVPDTRTVNAKALSSNVTLTTADVADSTDKRYVTDAQLSSLGNVTSAETTSADGQLTVFSGTGGKAIKKDASTGIVKVTSGVVSMASAGTDYLTPSGSAASLTNFPTLNQNTTGTAANLSGTPALPNGTTATTQSQADASTKLATTAYVDTGLGGKQASLGFTAVPDTRTVNSKALSSNITLTTADVADSTDKRYVSDANLTVIGNTSGVNTGDQLVFKTIAVAGQSDVVADTGTDTLTLVAGTNVTLTTNSATDSITITATGGGGGGGDVYSVETSSTDGQLPLFSGTGGKTLKKDASSGILKTTSGVVGTASAGTDYLTPTGSAASLTNFPTLNQNTTGTAANLSGTPALPNGTTATTQTQADASTKLATTAYVDTGLGGKQATLGFTAVPNTRTVNSKALSADITLTTGDIADSTNKRYVTDAALTVIGNTSGTNTGDQLVFKTFSVAGQSDVVADTGTDTLTLVAGASITLTTNATTDTITIAASTSGATAETFLLSALAFGAM